MNKQINMLLDISILMAKEYELILADPQAHLSNPNVISGIEELLSCWKDTYRATGLTADDHFQWAQDTPQGTQLRDAIANASASTTRPSARQTNTAAIYASPGTPAINLLDNIAMRNLARCVAQMLQALTGKRLAFFLNIFSEDPAEPRGQYISNADANVLIPEIDRLLRHLKQRSNSHTLH
jgi:hypothetical protein